MTLRPATAEEQVQGRLSEIRAERNTITADERATKQSARDRVSALTTEETQLEAPIKASQIAATKTEAASAMKTNRKNRTGTQWWAIANYLSDEQGLLGAYRLRPADAEEFTDEDILSWFEAQ